MFWEGKLWQAGGWDRGVGNGILMKQSLMITTTF